MSQPYGIRSLDGGGIMGAFAASALATVVRETDRRTIHARGGHAQNLGDLSDLWQSPKTPALQIAPKQGSRPSLLSICRSTRKQGAWPILLSICRSTQSSAWPLLPMV